MHLSTHFLENVIDANSYPLPEITDLAQRIRRIGLGVMGLADVFVALGIPYDSEAAVSSAGRSSGSWTPRPRSSRSGWPGCGDVPGMGKEHLGTGCHLRRDQEGNRIRPMQRLRNCNVTTVAPTGTISIIAGCSLGSSRSSRWRSCGTRPAC